MHFKELVYQTVPSGGGLDVLDMFLCVDCSVDFIKNIRNVVQI